MRLSIEPMPILGYCDRSSVAPGESIRFYVSCDGYDTYRADIVKLINGDLNAAGPGFKEEPVSTHISSEYPGVKQHTYAGSYIMVADHPLLQGTQGFTLQAMICPGTPEKGLQGLVTKWSAADQAGYGLFIDEQGAVALWIGDGSGQVAKISTGKRLLDRCWYFVAGSLDAATGQVRLYQEPVVGRANGRFSLPYPLDDTTGTVEQSTAIRPAATAAPLIMAGYFAGMDGSRAVVDGQYNGKIDRPRAAGCALTRDRMATLVENPSVEGVAAAWDFSEGVGPKGFQTPSRIFDRSPNRLHGVAVNLPARAVTGYNWDASAYNFVHAPEQYGAIHFHEDDMPDARWDVSFTLTVPDNLRSGIYAARLTAGHDEDYVPFYVRPKKGEPQSRIAFLVPTNSHLAYANDNMAVNADAMELTTGFTPILKAQDMHRHEHRELGASLYDTHPDGSGVCYSSWLRPLLTMRPKYRWWGTKVHQFNADLHLGDWLTSMGHEFDVITDQDVHAEGVELLKQYKVVMTGSHPEYWSGPALDALEAYQQAGGRFMYLGGNGMYWVISYHPENPNIIEVRRWGGTEAWTAQPGEYYHSFSGEMGGLWRNRGRAPQKVAGVGFVAQGLDLSSYYRRKPDSFDPRASWIFDEVGPDELIGNFGLVGGGAAGFELDIYDPALGTPRHAFLLASSEGHTDVMLRVREDVGMTLPTMGGTQDPKVRSDIVYYRTPNGGAVFSTGSITWCASLSHNNYDNNVSRIMNNVVKRFASDEPLPD